MTAKKLTERERTILAAVEHHANKPLTSFSEKLGMKDATIRYYVQNMIDSGIIERTIPFLDLYRLGYSYYTILLNASCADRSKLLDALGSSDRVCWVGVLGGEYQYGVTFLARRPGEVLEYLASVTSKVGNVITEKSISTKLSFQRFGRGYLGEGSRDLEAFEYSSQSMAIGMDEIDHKILTAMTEERHHSLRHLERTLDIPFSTLKRRVNRMEQRGVIVGYRYDYDLKRFGVLTHSLLVHAHGMDSALAAKLKEFCRAEPNVVYLVSTLGDWDFEVGVETLPGQDISYLTNKLYDTFGAALNKVKPLQIFKDHKAAPYPLSVTATQADLNLAA